jgi:hypothetical protein
MVLFLLVKLEWLQGTKHFASEHMAITIQEFLICIEMFIASIAHRVAFDYSQYSKEEDSESTPILRENNMFNGIKSVLFATDLVKGVKDSFSPEQTDFELSNEDV